MKRVVAVVLIILFGSLLSELFAQCPMCRMAAESNLENGGTAGKGLNSGILYMLTMPYILIGVIGFVWYRNRRGDDDVMIED
ncbi:MAG: hypothetical protein AAFQ02_11885 [Bacteroidota bacterium]